MDKTARGVNYAIFMKLTPVANLINLFCLIYTTIGVLPVVLTEVMLLGV
jgi:hypothetical protein